MRELNTLLLKEQQRIKLNIKRAYGVDTPRWTIRLEALDCLRRIVRDQPTRFRLSNTLAGVGEGGAVVGCVPERGWRKLKVESSEPFKKACLFLFYANSREHREPILEFFSLRLFKSETATERNHDNTRAHSQPDRNSLLAVIGYQLHSALCIVPTCQHTTSAMRVIAWYRKVVSMVKRSVAVDATNSPYSVHMVPSMV